MPSGLIKEPPGKIDLTDAPEILQAAVNKYLESHEGSEILTITKSDQTFYQDKTIVTTVYKAYFQWMNLLAVISFSVCSKEEWTDKEARENSMIAGDVKVFLEHSWWFKREKR